MSASRQEACGCSDCMDCRVRLASGDASDMASCRRSARVVAAFEVCERDAAARRATASNIGLAAVDVF